jgi:hypothetical protein
MRSKNSSKETSISLSKTSDPKDIAHEIALGIALMHEHRDVFQALADNPVDHSKTQK